MQITDRSDSDRSLHDTQKGNRTNIYHSNQQQKLSSKEQEHKTHQEQQQQSKGNAQRYMTHA